MIDELMAAIYIPRTIKDQIYQAEIREDGNRYM